MQRKRIIEIVALGSFIVIMMLFSASGVGARERMRDFSNYSLDSLLNAYSDSMPVTDTSYAEDVLQLADSSYHIDSSYPDDSLALTDSLLYTDSLLVADSLFHADSLSYADSLIVSDSLAFAETLTPKQERELRDSLRYVQRQKKKLYRDSVKLAKDSIRWAKPRVLETSYVPDSLYYKRLLTWNAGVYNNEFKPLEIDTSYNFWYSEYPYFHEDVDVTFLGTVGSATQNINFFKRRELDDFKAFAPYIVYSYTPEDMPFYNTKTPYTELAYWGNLFDYQDKEEINVRLLVTQNITPEWNVGLLMERWSAAGLLEREKTTNNSIAVTTNYLGKNYVLNAGYINQTIKRQENGGVQDSYWVRDTTVEYKIIPITLAEADNKLARNTGYINHTYSFSLKGKAKELDEEPMPVDSLALTDEELAAGGNMPSDSASRANARRERHAGEREEADRERRHAQNSEGKAPPHDRQHRDDRRNPDHMPPRDGAPADSAGVADSSAVKTGEFEPRMSIGHVAEISSYDRKYTDNIALTDELGRAFYNDAFYINPVQSVDSTRVLMIENKVFFNLQPWKRGAVVSDIFGGVGYKWKSIYGFRPEMFITGNRNIEQYDLYVYGGVRGQYRKYLNWGADVKYNLLGYGSNDMAVNAHVDVAFYPFKTKTDPVILSGKFHTSLKEPDWYSQHYYSNHYVWDNDFEKTSTTRVEAKVAVPKWNLEAAFEYGLVDNYLYHDTLGMIRQHPELLNVMTGYLKKNFKVWIFRFDHRVLFQYSSNQEVLPLPMFTFHFRYYIEFTAVKNVLDVQIGADATFNTEYYAPAYNPALGTFQLQTKELLGNNPYIDIFINLQWKRLSIFLKCVNVGAGWPNGDSFSAYHYVQPPTMFKFGIHWPFIIQ